MKKKPYIKKYGVFSGFNVWIVDGRYVRTHIDEEFTNFGQHYRFDFIPKNELWIDKPYSGGGEEKYYIEHMIVENRLMASGKTYHQAIRSADLVEQKERKKFEMIHKKIDANEKFESMQDRVKKRFLNAYSTKKLKIWIIDGQMVRNLFFIDFTQGGHDKVYPFIPEDEIWIDDDLGPRERKFVLLHEIHERNLMTGSQGVLNITRGYAKFDRAYEKVYEKAHKSASEIENYARHHPKKINSILRKEIKLHKIIEMHAQKEM
jgi:hypothetical protein